MSWQLTVFLCVTGALCFGALENCGVFARIRARLNPPAPPAPPTNSADLARLQSDVDKLKLALNFKEFKKI